MNKIILNKRVKAKLNWDFSKCAIKKHSNSFVAPQMFKHLMNDERIRLYPYSDTEVALVILDDPNPFRLAITKKIIADEQARMTRLDELGAPHYP